MRGGNRFKYHKLNCQCCFCKAQRGKHITTEIRKKIGIANTGKIRSEKFRENRRQKMFGENNPNYGKVTSLKIRKKIKNSILKNKQRVINIRQYYKEHPNAPRLENNPAWNGGKSFEPYTPEFNGRLKKFIRERDSNICQFCGKTKKENNQELSVNHINYIKEDCRHRNLIALCRSDNARANIERDKWQFLFETLQEIRRI